jgi:opacity protein-like surface antigen
MMGNSEYSFSEAGEFVEFEHKIKSIPINANFYFKPNVPFASMKPYMYAGAAMYYTKLDFGLNFSDEAGYDAELSTWGFGIHGGGGMEFSIVPSLSFDVGVKIRWASIGGFEGTATDFEGETRDVFLAGGKSEGEFYYGPELTTNEGEYDEGKVDLTGYTIYIGFKAGF